MSGVANMPRGLTSLANLRATIRDLPRSIQESVATDAAAKLDMEVRADFAAGRTVYDSPRPLSVAEKTTGKPLTLVKTERTRKSLGVVSIGSIVRASLGPPYAKYLVGRYKVLPQTLPASWQAYLVQLVADYRKSVEERLAR